MAFSILYITYPDKATAERISDQMVSERLAACANIFPISSSYWWEAVVQRDDEWVSLLKTSNEIWPVLRDRVEALHPYEVPCIMRLVGDANESYEKWILEQVS